MKCLFISKNNRALTLVLFLVVVAFSCAQTHANDGLPNKALPRVLVLVMDGVPYQFMVSMYEQGYFKSFYPPSRMVSSFPSMTDVAFTEIFRMPDIKGYQQVYFSREKNKVIGGLGSEMFRLEEFERHFDSIVHGKVHLMSLYLSSYRNAKNEWKELKDSFWGSDGSEYFYGYVSGSDAIAHRYGPEGLHKFLTFIDAEVATLKKDYFDRTGDDLEIVILSDHGNSLMKGKLINVKSELKKKGLSVGGSLVNKESVVVTVAGVVSYLALYSDPEVAPEIAESLVGIEGVDLVMYPSVANEQNSYLKGVTVLNSKGKANIYFNELNDCGRYEMITGDPLGYDDIFYGLITLFPGCMKQEVLLLLTAPHHYPNAILRIYRCFYGAVESPAAVVVSLKPGYEHSNKIIKAVSVLGGRWGTHGSLHATDSLGVYMRTDYKTKDVDTLSVGDELILPNFTRSVSVEVAATESSVR